MLLRYLWSLIYGSDFFFNVLIYFCHINCIGIHWCLEFALLAIISFMSTVEKLRFGILIIWLSLILMLWNISWSFIRLSVFSFFYKHFWRRSSHVLHILWLSLILVIRRKILWADWFLFLWDRLIIFKKVLYIFSLIEAFNLVFFFVVITFWIDCLIDIRSCIFTVVKWFPFFLHNLSFHLALILVQRLILCNCSIFMS